MSEILEKLGISATKKFLAVDIGSSRLKVMLVRRKGKKVFLLKSFSIPEMKKYFNGMDILNANGIADALQQILRIENLKQKKVVMSFTSSKLQTKIINAPELSEKELNTFIHVEFPKQFSNYNKITDVVDYMPIGVYQKPGSTQPQLSVLLSLFPASEAGRIIKEFQSKKFFVEAIDVDIHALGNIGKVYNDNETRDMAVFHTGSETSQLVFLKDDAVIFSRNITFGVDAMLRSIQNQLEISKETLDSIVEEHGLYLEEDVTVNHQTILADDFNEAAKDYLTSTLNDVYRSFQFVNTSYGTNVSRILLTGGLSLVRHAPDLCEEVLETEVETFELEKDEYLELRNGLQIHNQTGKSIKGDLAVCFGLAIRGLL